MEQTAAFFVPQIPERASDNGGMKLKDELMKLASCREMLPRTEKAAGG